MIKVRRFPSVHIVARGAIVIEIAAAVVGFVGLGKGRAVTAEAVACRIGIGIGMTRLAFNLSMCALERKAGDVVIKSRRCPCCHFVAGAAVLGEVGGFVIRIGGAEIIIAMARITIGRRSRKLGRVTRGTIKPDVPAFEYWSRRVIKFRPCPIDGR